MLTARAAPAFVASSSDRGPVASSLATCCHCLPTTSQAVFIVSLVRVWPLVAPQAKAALAALTVAQLAAMAARTRARRPRWLPAVGFVLRATSLGLGLAAQTMPQQLSRAASGAATTLAQLLFGSLVPPMLLFSLAWPLRLRCVGADAGIDTWLSPPSWVCCCTTVQAWPACALAGTSPLPHRPLPPRSWSIAAQAVLVATTTRHARLVCSSAAFQHGSAQRTIHALYQATDALASFTPLRLSVALVPAGTVAECTALLAFLQISGGLLAPVLWQVRCCCRPGGASCPQRGPRDRELHSLVACAAVAPARLQPSQCSPASAARCCRSCQRCAALVEARSSGGCHGRRRHQESQEEMESGAGCPAWRTAYDTLSSMSRFTSMPWCPG